MTLPEAKLDALLARHAMVEAELSHQRFPPGDLRQAVARAGRRSPRWSTASRRIAPSAFELAGLDAMLADPDPEMRAIAAAEKPELDARHAALAQEIRLALIPKDAMDERNVILEIRAGTGGDEAALFAGDLLRMYERFATVQGWTAELISASDGPMGGYKEVIAEIRGRGAFAKLKFESGVHRVQRVPATEGSGRVHTSAATVAVLPEVEEVDIAINEADLKIDTMRSGGAPAASGTSTRPSRRCA